MDSSSPLGGNFFCLVAFIAITLASLYASFMMVNLKSDCTYSPVSVNPKLPAMADSKSKLLQQIHSSTELHQQYHLLTIAIDSEGSCPEKCAFIHSMLPQWVRYRYIHFTDMADFSIRLEGHSGHVMIVARSNIKDIANWAVERKTSKITTGLFHMADELFDKRDDIEHVYDKFDYVMRHYYPGKKLYSYTIHALGNITCGGASPQTLPIPDRVAGPRWGVHWVPQVPALADYQFNHASTSTYPTSMRPKNCSFIGRSTELRSEMKSAIERFGSSMQCEISFTEGFQQGHPKFHYFSYDIATTKIGLCPWGNNAETMRLPELLTFGAVPATLSKDYLYATFRSVPAIIGEDWKEVVKMMKYYLREEKEVLNENAKGKKSSGRISELEFLSRNGTKFYRDLGACMIEDMDFILRGSFGL